MNINKRTLKIMKWTARILSIGILLLGLPFYFGYGNPLPFINPDYTLWDNMWLTVFPLMFIGLFLGLKYEKLGGYIVVVPVGLGLILGVIIAHDFVVHMLVPLVPGILYLTVGYIKKCEKAKCPKD